MLLKSFGTTLLNQDSAHKTTNMNFETYLKSQKSYTSFYSATNPRIIMPTGFRSPLVDSRNRSPARNGLFPRDRHPFSSRLRLFHIPSLPDFLDATLHNLLTPLYSAYWMVLLILDFYASCVTYHYKINI